MFRDCFVDAFRILPERFLHPPPTRGAEEGEQNIQASKTNKQAKQTNKQTNKTDKTNKQTSKTNKQNKTNKLKP